MRKSNRINSETDISRIESTPPAEYESYVAEGYYGAESAGDEQQLIRNLFGTLRKHWVLILSLNLAVTAAAIIYTAQKPDFYKASSRIQVNAEMNPASDKGGSVVVNSVGGDPAYFTTQLQILEGAGLLRRVVKTLDLEHNQAFLNPQRGKSLTVWENVRKMFGFYRPPAAETARLPLAASKEGLSLQNGNPRDPDQEAQKLAPFVATLRKNLSVSPVKDTRTSTRETRLIEVEYSHADPAVAAKIVNTIGDIYVLQNLEQKVKSNASAGDFLQKRVAELQSDIRQGEERLINYSKSNQIVSLDTDQNTVVKRFSDLGVKLGQAENDRISAQTAYQAAMQNRMRTATAESKDAQVVSLESKLGELRQKLLQLKTDYTDEWFEVVQIKKQIASAENQLSSLRQRASDIQTSTLEEKLNEAAARERDLRAEFDKQRAQVMQQNVASINYKIIQQEIETNKSLLNNLLLRSRENDVILNGTPNNVLVADRALEPTAPAGPERSKNVLIAFVASLALGIGLAFALDWFNDSLKYSENLERSIGIPILAAIPSAPQSLTMKMLPGNFGFSQKSRRIKRIGNLDAFDKPEFSEPYLQLRTYLMLSTAGGPPQTILVTSGIAGEGKTLTSLMLARTLAESGKPVLLIDADMRFPRVHLVKGLPNNSGLTTLLTAEELNADLIEKTIIKDSVANLDILTAGERSASPANLLSSQEMSDLLIALTGKYAHIIIDSPPVLYFADSIIMSTLTDAVIIVAREHISFNQGVLKTRKMLQNVGANIIGMVVNGVARKLTGYNNYKYYRDDDSTPDGSHISLKLN